MKKQIERIAVKAEDTGSKVIVTMTNMVTTNIIEREYIDTKIEIPYFDYFDDDLDTNVVRMRFTKETLTDLINIINTPFSIRD